MMVNLISLTGHHGIHPRVTHGLVNMFLLFGPLAIVLYYQTLRDSIGYFLKTNKNDQHAQRDTSVRPFLIGCIYTSLLALSCFPHQEPRFILPIILPLLTLFGSHFFGSNCNSYKLFFWIVFNILGIIFFGFMHQGKIMSVR